MYVVRFIKSHNLFWLGHLIRIPDDRILKKIAAWKPEARRLRERFRKRWRGETVILQVYKTYSPLRRRLCEFALGGILRLECY